MTGIDNWASLRAACEKYGATSVTVPALVAAFEERLSAHTAENDAACPDHPSAGTGYTDPTGGDPFMGGPVLIRVCRVCGREVPIPPVPEGGPGMSGDTGDTETLADLMRAHPEVAEAAAFCTATDTFGPIFEELLALVAAERERGAAEAVQAVRAQYEGYLHSDNLDPAWIAGWHSAINHAAAALRAVLPPESEGPGPEEEEA